MARSGEIQAVARRIQVRDDDSTVSSQSENTFGQSKVNTDDEAASIRASPLHPQFHIRPMGV
jgi:hypothetical protein